MRQPVAKHAMVGDNSWSLGNSSSAPILALHPQIEDGEDYEFWLYRLAAGYGLSKVQFCNRVPGIEYDPEIASTLTGIPIERLRRGTFRALSGLLPFKVDEEFEKTIRKIGWQDRDSWLTWHLPHYGFRGGEFCRLCLNERAAFKLNWYVSLFVSCPKHGCLLSHLCGSCGTPFTGYRHLANVDLSGKLEMVRKCSRCHGSVSAGARITPVALEVAYLEALHAELVTQSRCSQYFSALRRLLEAMSTPYRDRQATERLRAALLPTPQSGYFDLFETSDAKQRQNYLLAIMDLFTDWPYTFAEILAGHGIKFHNRFFRPIMPRWLKSAIRLAKRYDPNQVRSVRAEFWQAARAEGWLDAARFLCGETRSHSAVPMTDFNNVWKRQASRSWIPTPKSCRETEDEPLKRGPGRPKGVPPNYSKRTLLHPEARARIAEAQKRRRAVAMKAKQCRDVG